MTSSHLTSGLTVEQALLQAVDHHKAGRLLEAERLYRAILEVQPRHPDANHNLGALAWQVGQPAASLPLLRAALEGYPNVEQFCLSYAAALLAAGQLADAQHIMREAVQRGLDTPAVLALRQKIEIAALLALNNAGQYAEAERMGLALSEQYPQAGVVWKVLGAALKAQGKEALPAPQKAAELLPEDAQAHNYLGITLKSLGRLDSAAASYRNALQIQPDFAEAHCNLGNVLADLGQLDAAVASYRNALQIKPDLAEAMCNLGNALTDLGQLDSAVANCRRALELKPDFAEAHNNLGNALKALGQPDNALASYRRALALKPDFAEAHSNLGDVLQGLGQLDNALASCRRALALKPDFAEAHNNLGNALKEFRLYDDALACYRRALQLKPDFAEAHNNLGNALKDQSQLDEAIGHYREALGLKPDYPDAHSNLLFALNYHPDMDAQDIYRAYQEYDASRAMPLRSVWRAHGNDKNSQRRLRVGYVSPDFRNHSCKYFLEPLLARHDKTQVEVYAYAELNQEDEASARYRSYVEHWIPTKEMSDAQLALRIRADGIDILVDLAGHTSGNRLLTFAHKPAPVSVSWLGYGYTTGLSAIDYYLTDEICAPAGSENLFAEQPWRVATPAYVYRPKVGMGEVNSLPASQRGYITFGTLTRAVRINPRTVRAWAEILNAVPDARLVVDSASFYSPAMQEKLAANFVRQGIARDRLSIGFHSPPWDTLRGTDIGLDCFPHNSGATLFETLYMGVPYITLAGRPSVGRLGGSILHGAGHPEWIAESEDEYVAKAVELASDIARLAEVRAALRGEMQASALMDEAGFARKVEAAYRGMWQNWCATDD
jgi:protein O-GlcNAc transferase